MLYRMAQSGLAAKRLEAKFQNLVRQSIELTRMGVDMKAEAGHLLAPRPLALVGINTRYLALYLLENKPSGSGDHDK